MCLDLISAFYCFLLERECNTYGFPLLSCACRGQVLITDRLKSSSGTINITTSLKFVLKTNKEKHTAGMFKSVCLEQPKKEKKKKKEKV